MTKDKEDAPKTISEAVEASKVLEEDGNKELIKKSGEKLMEPFDHGVPNRMRKKRSHTLFDTAYDTEEFKKLRGFEPDLRNTLELFSTAKVGNKILTNMFTPGVLGSDSVFQVEKVGYLSRFNDVTLAYKEELADLFALLSTDMLIEVTVGFVSQIEGFGVWERNEKDLDFARHFTLPDLHVPVVIPARQCFKTVLHLSDTLKEALNGFQGQKALRVFLHGTETRDIY